MKMIVYDKQRHKVNPGPDNRVRCPREVIGHE